MLNNPPETAAAGTDEPKVEPLVYPIKTTQALLGGVSRSTIYRDVKAGKLELVEIRGRAMITARSIKRRAGLDQAA